MVSHFADGMMFGNQRINESSMRGEGAQRRLFVVTHEAAIAEHIGPEDRSEHGVPPVTRSVR